MFARAARSTRSPRGSALIMALILSTILSALTLMYASRISSSTKRMEVDIAAGKALELAQSANDWNMQRIWRGFDISNLNYKLGTISNDPVSGVLSDIRTAPESSGNPPKQFDMTVWTDTNDWANFGQGQVKLSAMVVPNSASSKQVEIELKAWARVKDELKDRYIEREVRRIARFTLIGANKVFDFAYFVNNFGWMWGSPIYIEGNMGSNANLSFRYGPTVNGSLYAAVNPLLGATGTIKDGYPISASLTGYRSTASGNPLFPPTNPAYTEDVNDNGVLDPGEDTNGNGIIDFTDYSLGFPGVTASRPQERLLGQAPLDMPFLGDLEAFKNQAQAYVRPARPDLGEPGGTTGAIVKQLKAPGLDPTDPANYNILIKEVYGDKDDEKGFISNPGATITTTKMTNKLDNNNKEKNGNVALIGTDAQPLVILGPVVITNDLVIKGTVTGQGTFFTGRNIHVVGDITYKDPPANVQNDPNFSSTIAANQSKDLVGFASKGSVILGQYYRSDDYWNYLKNNFWNTGFQNNTAQSYQTDPTDASIGYVTGYIDGRPYFHGDYTKADGGKRYGDTGNWMTDPTKSRRFYESSFSNNYIASISSGRPQKIYGVFYTNHLIGGRVGGNSTGITFFGGMVARDEGIMFNKKAYFLYDPRSADSEPGSHIEIFLPKGTTMQNVIWEELSPGQ